jgi:hypothetical protein
VRTMDEAEFRACQETEVRKGRPTALKLWADPYLREGEAKPDDPLRTSSTWGRAVTGRLRRVRGLLPPVDDRGRLPFVLEDWRVRQRERSRCPVRGAPVEYRHRFGQR